MLVGVVELLGDGGLCWGERGAAATLAASGSGGGQAVAVLATMSSRCSSARTESILTMARPSAVAVLISRFTYSRRWWPGPPVSR